MREIQIVSLLGIAVAAVLLDLQNGRIPNGLVMTGLLWGMVYQIFTGGMLGLVLFFGGICLPLVFFGAFYYFRMIGAGDVKLLCVAGGFLGPSACFVCITATILSGGLISVLLMLRRHNFHQRLAYFSGYISHCSKEKRWGAYLTSTEEDARFCFSIPVLLGILYYVGGMM